MQFILNIGKKHFYLIAVIIALVGVVSFVQSQGGSTPNPGHDANSISININGTFMSLQDAFDQGDLSGKDDIQMTKEFYFGCGTHNIPASHQLCLLMGVRHDDEGDDSDFIKRVYNSTSPDANGKMNWKVQNWCGNDRKGSYVRCIDFV